jgi:hypothetical protein
MVRSWYCYFHFEMCNIFVDLVNIISRSRKNWSVETIIDISIVYTFGCYNYLSFEA